MLMFCFGFDFFSHQNIKTFYLKIKTLYLENQNFALKNQNLWFFKMYKSWFYQSDIPSILLLNGHFSYSVKIHLSQIQLEHKANT